jgi:hypothetical protein
VPFNVKPVLHAKLHEMELLPGRVDGHDPSVPLATDPGIVQLLRHGDAICVKIPSEQLVDVKFGLACR